MAAAEEVEVEAEAAVAAIRVVSAPLPAH
jgi:hypothetical protein